MAAAREGSCSFSRRSPCEEIPAGRLRGWDLERLHRRASATTRVDQRPAAVPGGSPTGRRGRPRRRCLARGLRSDVERSAVAGLRLSVVIPAYDEAEGIQNTLGPLVARWRRRHRHEVIVVDDGGTDGTAQASPSSPATTGAYGASARPTAGGFRLAVQASRRSRADRGRDRDGGRAKGQPATTWCACPPAARGGVRVRVRARASRRTRGCTTITRFQLVLNRIVNFGPVLSPPPLQRHRPRVRGRRREKVIEQLPAAAAVEAPRPTWSCRSRRSPAATPLRRGDLLDNAPPGRRTHLQEMGDRYLFIVPLRLPGGPFDRGDASAVTPRRGDRHAPAGPAAGAPPHVDPVTPDLQHRLLDEGGGCRSPCSP